MSTRDRWPGAEAPPQQDEAERGADAADAGDAAAGAPPGLSRRQLLARGSATLAGGALLLGGSGALAQADVPGAKRPREGSAADTGGAHASQRAQAPGRAGRDYLPVTVPNGAKLPWKVVEGVKVFHLVAEEVDHEFAPGLKALCWGYNGRVHGP
ncbi:MAG TPA: copper oxidase, partial [Aggregicoccus sp.]|nr:copper oxidase [Aggregicoccus sp.]